MICKRYLPPHRIEEFLSEFDKNTRTVIGQSVENRPIELLKIGSGAFKVLMWSQMHGNETTTTKALFDFIPWFLNLEQRTLQNKFTLHIILQLNPDGSERYTRANANHVDLNRDAIDKTQPESIALRNVYDSIQPDLCLNLHGQRTIYAAGVGGPSASLSFLAPAADFDRMLTPARIKAMHLISGIADSLAEVLPNAIGRYDDTFNPNCVGDSFTQSGTPTILFEAGHVPGDYQREQTKIHILNAYQALFEQLAEPSQPLETIIYSNLPQNKVEFCDLMVSNICLRVDGVDFVDQKIAIQYKETLIDGRIEFLPEMVAYGSRLTVRAHKYKILPDALRSIPLQFKEESLVTDSRFNDVFALNN